MNNAKRTAMTIGALAPFLVLVTFGTWSSRWGIPEKLSAFVGGSGLDGPTRWLVVTLVVVAVGYSLIAPFAVSAYTYVGVDRDGPRGLWLLVPFLLPLAVACFLTGGYGSLGTWTGYI